MAGNNYKTFGILVFCVLLFSGCQLIQPVQQTSDYLIGKVQIEQKKQVDKTLATVKCQEFCQNKITIDDQDINIGPCLDEEIIPDWSCDVSHSLRQPIDDDPRNQCANFRTGVTQHLVEVDGNCNLIKAE